LLGAFDSRCALGPLAHTCWCAAPLRSAEADDQFRARSVRGACAVNGRSSPEQGLQDRKDNDMIAALVVAWFAVVGLVLIARADYGRRTPAAGANFPGSEIRVTSLQTTWLSVRVRPSPTSRGGSSRVEHVNTLFGFLLGFIRAVKMRLLRHQGALPPFPRSLRQDGMRKRALG